LERIPYPPGISDSRRKYSLAWLLGDNESASLKRLPYPISILGVRKEPLVCHTDLVVAITMKISLGYPGRWCCRAIHKPWGRLGREEIWRTGRMWAKGLNMTCANKIPIMRSGMQRHCETSRISTMQHTNTEDVQVGPHEARLGTLLLLGPSVATDYWP